MRVCCAHVERTRGTARRTHQPRRAPAPVRARVQQPRSRPAGTALRAGRPLLILAPGKVMTGDQRRARSQGGTALPADQGVAVRYQYVAGDIALVINDYVHEGTGTGRRRLADRGHRRRRAPARRGRRLALRHQQPRRPGHRRSRRALRTRHPDQRVGERRAGHRVPGSGRRGSAACRTVSPSSGRRGRRPDPARRPRSRCRPTGSAPRRHRACRRGPDRGGQVVHGRIGDRRHRGVVVVKRLRRARAG